MGAETERLVGIYSHNTERERSYRPFSIPNFRDLQQRKEVFTDVYAMLPNQVGLTEGGLTRRAFSLTASANFLDAIAAPPLLGRTFLPEEDERAVSVAMVSHAWWERHGSDPSVVGRTLQINGRAHTIVGVTAKGFSGTFSPELYLPLGSRLHDVDPSSSPFNERDHHAFTLVGRLQPGFDLAEANTRLRVISDRPAAAYPEANNNQLLTVAKLP